MKTPVKVILVLVVLGVFVMLYHFDPSQYLWIPKCPTKLLLGIDCPGCGCQRAIHAFLHGDVRAAIHYNPFIVFALPYALMALGYRHIRKESLRNRIGAIVESKFMTRTYIVVFFCWFVIRNI
jgi:hypothetical protein